MKKRTGRRLALFLRLALVLPILSSFAVISAAAEPSADEHVVVLEIEGPVTPVMISYIERGIQTAGETGAQALVIQLNTPGGQVDLMNKIVQSILASDTPIVVFVYPQGAYAASAGTLITLAGHVAAMAPGTTIGAASPVGSQGEDLGETMETKLKEDLKAQARALAKRRGAEAMVWAESAVEDAKAATAQEALDLGVIDFVATDLSDLLQQIDGFVVLLGDEELTLRTAESTIETLPMSSVEGFLHTITNPTIAFILLTIGLNGLLFELSSPGGYVAGVVGAICLLLAFYALGVLPVNYTGLIFIVLAFVLFVIDVKAPTHGALTIGGIVSLVVGALVLFNSPLYRVSITAIITVAAATGLFFAFLVAKVIGAQNSPILTGREGLIGQLAQARTDLCPEGKVLVKGELWDALAENAPVASGSWVEIQSVQGFLVRVRGVSRE